MNADRTAKGRRGRLGAAAQIDRNFAARRRPLGPQIAHGDRPAQCRRERAAGDSADFRVAGQHAVTLARHAAARQLPADAHRPAWFFLQTGEHLATRKRPAIEIDGELQPGFEWIDRFGELMPVERHGRFEPQGIAGAQASGHSRQRRGRRDELFPQGQRQVLGHDDFPAILAGVAGAADERRGGEVSGERDLAGPVVFQLEWRGAESLSDNLPCLWPLNRDHGRRGRPIDNLHAGRRLLSCEPGQDLGPIRSIYDNQPAIG